jgi:hypothetical protein
MKPLNAIVSVIIILASVILCQQIISKSFANQQNNRDYAELNHIKYGLLSVDEWKRQLSVIFIEEIHKLYLSKTNEQVLRKHIEVQLNTLIDKVDKRMRKENKGSAGGWIKQTFINVFVSLDDIKKGIPAYANAVIHEMTTAKSEGQIKAILNEQVNKYLSETYNTQDTSELSRILIRTGSRDIEGAKIKLDKDIAAIHRLISGETILLIILSALLFILSFYSKQPLVPLRYLLLVVSLGLLLLTGVSTPMIDIEAKISKISFMLMGHPVHFDNQVLYFQSKSILNIFQIMITQKDIQMKFVGLLVITFSIFFPVLKIISSIGYYYNVFRSRQNPVVQFFVLKAGKWSMADVMVVGIFMAYIGFNGIINNQLGAMNTAGQELSILTTNGTALQPGYYLFLTYALLALFLSGYLTRHPQA